MIIKKMFKFIIIFLFINLFSSINAFANNEFNLWVNSFDFKIFNPDIKLMIVRKKARLTKG